MSDSTHFDTALAADLIGKVVLVGITYEDRRGEVKRLEQFFGTVASADAKRGIAVLLSGQGNGGMRWLPPTTEGYFAASKGEYRLKSTGEVVTNPDYTVQWTVVQPDA